MGATWSNLGYIGYWKKLEQMENRTGLRSKIWKSRLSETQPIKTVDCGYVWICVDRNAKRSGDIRTHTHRTCGYAKQKWDLRTNMRGMNQTSHVKPAQKQHKYGSPRPKMGISPINTGNTTQNKDINSRQRHVEWMKDEKSEHIKSVEIRLNGTVGWL